ncbi:MAG: hypothetical protein E6I63_00915 [Chloroflexi bacterium]|nr:MAG: hypothetical protein E6I63_00915 [Chloroflexota bacterium]
MIFERLEIRGFRSYAEPIEVRFDGGLNVFMGRNEAGKTGLLRAIQCALFPPSRGTDRHSLLAEGEGECRLALEYRLPGGERWRVERDLTAYKHALHAWRDNSWEPVSTALSDIADVVRAHTGCDEALFERTLLVRHEAVEVPASADVTKTLAARLELVAGGSGRVSAVAAAAKLEAGFKKLSGPYKGEIVVAAERLREALGGLDRAQALAGRLVETRSRLEQTAEALTRLELEQTDAAAVLKRARDVAAAERDLKDAQEKRAMLDQALTVAAPSVPAWAWPAIAAGALLALAGVLLALLWQAVPGAGFVLCGAVAAGAGALQLRPRTVAPAAQAELEARRSSLGRDVRELQARLEELAVYRLAPAAFERLQRREREIPAELAAANREHGSLSNQLIDLAHAAEAIPELEDAVAVQQRRLDRLKFKAEALKLAFTELAAAIEDIRRSAGPRIAAAATGRLQTITPDYAVGLEDTAGLTFRATWADGSPFERRDLSDGTADQFYFAVRVALAEVLLGDLNPPLLLDDPFRYCDSERRAALHRLLLELAGDGGPEGRQVLYFSVEEPEGLLVTHPLPLVRVPA